MNTFVQARQFLLDHREDYQAAYAGFRWPRLQQFNWALDYFDVLAQDNAAPALWIVDEDGSEHRHTYAELSRLSSQAANWLRAQGVRRGDRVLLMLGNEPALWQAMLGLMKLGAVVIPATTLLTPEDLQDRFERARVGHVIVGAAQIAKFEAFPGPYTRIVVGEAPAPWRSFAQAQNASAQFTADAPTQASDPLLLYFTSGTTSKPKLVLHSHQSYPVGHLSTMYWLGLKPGDIHLNISSPGWAKHAWSCFFAPWNAGACVFIFNYQRFHAPQLLETLVRYGVSSLCAPPTVWRMLVQEDLQAYAVRLRELIGAGEPLNPEIIDRVRQAWGITIRDGFGQTETTAQIGNSPAQRVKSGAMGRPLPGFEIALLDADGNPREEGEIAIRLKDRPLGLTIGYDGDAARSAAALGGAYYRTGDIAMRDGEGYYTYVGRADDVFKSSDYRISPFEVESVLIEHPAVAEAAVVPSPDDLRLSVPKAFVMLRHGHVASPELAADILAFTAARLAPYKRIRRLEFAELPKTISGKIRRVELRVQEMQRQDERRRAQEFWEQDFAGRVS
ncbi:acetyl-CoA synthetase [Solimonas aquatica]|uniref:Acetyl-CoA synthetase n=1 Tax=Solimonas aquatica TaxID=489703 RepID=A0A1H9JVN4_9GAMM|nr:AMP-binding protein [Solimonas aquatica]SEQ90899.1 acetyl-CoA synthetase [Solimonas aquatica]